MTLRELANALRAARMNLTGQQLAGKACVHCGRPFGGTARSEPYARRTRQCAGHCQIETAVGLHTAFLTHIHPSRRPFVRWNQLGGVGPRDAVVTATDGRIDATSEPVRRPDADRLAEQAGRLGFDANVLPHRDEKGPQR